MLQIILAVSRMIDPNSLNHYIQRKIRGKLKCKQTDDPKIVRLSVEIDNSIWTRYVATCNQSKFLQHAKKIKMRFLKRKYLKWYMEDAYFEKLVRQTKSEEISALFSEHEIDADT